MAHLLRLEADRIGVAATLPLPAVGLDIGRDEACACRLDDDSASRRHAELRPESEGWVLRDLGSTNGTHVNGERVETRRLLHGDRIRIGRTHLVFEDAEAASRPAEPVPLPGAAAPEGRLRGLGPALLALLGLSAAAGFLLLFRKAPSAGRTPPRPVAAAPSGAAAEGAPAGAATPGTPALTPALDAPDAAWRAELSIQVPATYDQAFESPDQSWAQEQPLELSSGAIILRRQGSRLVGVRRWAEGWDELSLEVDGDTVAALVWKGGRKVMRTMAGAPPQLAREETWTFNAPALGPAPSGEGQAWVAGRDPEPLLAHALSFHPQGATLQLVRAAWRGQDAQGKGGADTQVRLLLRPQRR